MTAYATSSVPVSRDQLARFCVETMCRCGMTETDARLAADVLVTTDLWGVHTHGTKSLRLYLKRMREGGLKARHVITVDSGAGALAISSPITLGGSQTWANNSANTLTVSGNIANCGKTLTINGTGAHTFVPDIVGVLVYGTDERGRGRGRLGACLARLR